MVSLSKNLTSVGVLGAPASPRPHPRSIGHRLRYALFALALSLSFGAQRVSAADLCSDLFSLESIKVVDNPLFTYLNKNPSLEQVQVGIKPLQTGALGLAAKLSLIARAQKTIDLSYYIFRPDTSGYAVLDALKSAMARGVSVRFIVDGAGTFSAGNAHFDSLVDFNKTLFVSRLEVKVVNPIASVRKTISKIISLFYSGKWLFAPSDINRRSHDKILLVDAGTTSSWAVLGGRNIGDEYYGVGSAIGAEFIDYEILVKGGSMSGSADPLETVMKYYNILFEHELSLVLTGTSQGDETHLTRMSEAKEGLRRDVEFEKQMDLTRQSAFWSDGFDSTTTTLVSEIQNLVKKLRLSFDTKQWLTLSTNPNITRSFFEIAKEAHSSIVIVSPYVMFAKKDIEFMREWLIRNPQAVFSIYTNSYSTADSMLTMAIFQNLTLPRLRALQKDPKIGDRLRIFQYKGETLLHVKAIIIDDSATLVTTSNFDARSRLLNSEIGMWMASALNLKALKNLIFQVEAQSEHLSLQSLANARPQNLREQLRLRILAHLTRIFEITHLDLLF